MMNMNLPLVLRRVNTEKTCKARNSPALRQSFLRELNRSEGSFSQKIVSGFMQAFSSICSARRNQPRFPSGKGLRPALRALPESGPTGSVSHSV
jgi:hypothetical protein